jgi:hypothetical protein
MHVSPPDQSTGGRSLRGNLPKPVWTGTDQETMDVAGRSTADGSVTGSERPMACRDCHHLTLTSLLFFPPLFLPPGSNAVR